MQTAMEHQIEIRLSILEDKVDRLLVAMSDIDTRQRSIEKDLAKISVITGFVSAGISTAIVMLLSMFRK